MTSPSNVELVEPPVRLPAASEARAAPLSRPADTFSAEGPAPREKRRSSTGAEGHSLTRRAQLTLGNTILTQVTKFACVLLVMPFVISRLGAELYGAWVMIQQLVGYLATGEVRATSTLKFSLAVTQHCDDHCRRNRQIGAAVVLWLLSLPLMLAISVMLVVYTPVLIRCGPENAVFLRWTMAITVATFILGRLASIPNSVLRGNNLAYKAMGAGAVATVLGYLGMAIAASTRTQLPGMAAVLLIQMMLLAGIEFVVTKQAIPWIRVTWPRKRELSTFTGRTLWLSVSGVGALALNASDLALIGYLLGPSAAGIYAVTATASRLASQPLTHLLSAAVPGVAGICGAGQWSRVAAVREEMLTVGVCFSVVASAVVVAVNESFVSLWVGSELYIGPFANTLIAVAGVFIILVRIDGSLMDCFLMIPQRAIAVMLAGTGAIAVAALLCKQLGMTGVALAVFSGQASLACFYAFAVNRKLARESAEPGSTASFLRLGFVCVLVLGGAWLAQFAGPSQTWLSLLGRSAAVAGISSGLLFGFALNSEQRLRIAARLGRVGR